MSSQQQLQPAYDGIGEVSVTAPEQRPFSGWPRVSALLRVEGLAALGLSLALFAEHGASWWWFVLLLFPDVSALGYVAGRRRGATAYNLAHTYTGPAVLGVYGVLAGNDVALSLALVWAAHIGMDRALGYGLKYATSSKDTHLQRI
jgi:hypothetical protein